MSRAGFRRWRRCATGSAVVWKRRRESLFGSVECCSGCFSAYRRDIFNSVVDEWLDQRVFGFVDQGDDRALTNIVLKNHAVIYHAGAVCWTFAPPNWRGFMRQQLRWKKSWVLQTCYSAMYVMHRKSPIVSIGFYMNVVASLFSPVVLFYSIFYILWSPPWATFLFYWA